MKRGVIWIYGQPGAGKTTFAKHFIEQRQAIGDLSWLHLDGDTMRQIFSNYAYDRTGRFQNITMAVKIAQLLNEMGYNVVCSFVTPYADMRKMIRESFSRRLLVYLHYDPAKEQRGREQNWAMDFEAEEHGMTLSFDTGLCHVCEYMYDFMLKNSNFQNLFSPVKMN